MRYLKQLLLVALLVAALEVATAKRTDDCVAKGSGNVLAAKGQHTRILTDAQSHASVHRAVASFVEDVESAVPGAQVSVKNISSTHDVARESQGAHSTLLVGALNDPSSLVQSAATESGTNVTHVNGQWEAWHISPAQLSSSAGGSSDVVLVAGADKRGTIYALYTLSEQMGVSPWHW